MTKKEDAIGWFTMLREKFTGTKYGEYLDIAIKALEQQQEWIPASERLPKAGEYIGDVAKYYLVQNEYGDMMVAHYAHSRYWEQMHQLSPIADDVVAWMPLPEPWKAGSEDEDADSD